MLKFASSISSRPSAQYLARSRVPSKLASQGLRSSIALYSTNNGTPVTEIRDLELFAAFTDSQKPSIVDFYATWCGPCKAIAPVFDKLAGAVPEAQFARVDVDEAPDVAGQNGVTAMPTILFFKDGKETGKIVGADLQKLIQLIQTNTGVDVKTRKL